MLPDTDDQPPRVAQPRVRVTIALDVPIELVDPPLAVRSRRRPVIRTAVPEAAVDEDRYTRSDENQIGTAAKPGQDPVVHAVTPATRPQSPP